MNRKTSLLVVALVVLALGSVAEAAESRTVTNEYNTITIYGVPDQPQGHISNVVKFRPHKGERFVSIVLDDLTDQPAYAIFEQDFDGDGTADLSQEICGATQTPIAFESGVKITVSAQQGMCGGAPMGSTLGSVTATFTR